MKPQNKMVWLLFMVHIHTGLMSSDVCQTPICHQAALNLLQAMEPSLDPCKDFYLYACANFIKEHPVPSNVIAYGQFNRVEEDINNKILEILTSGDDVINITKPLASAIDSFNTCLETEESISQVLEVIVYTLGGSPMISSGSWSSDHYDVMSSLSNSMLYGNSPLFQVCILQDQKNTSAYILNIDQLEMKINIDYYLKPESHEDIVKYYVKFIVNSTLALVGDVNYDVEEMAQEIFNFETEIAHITSSIVDKQNSTRRYNRMTIGHLQNLTDPEFKIMNWTEFLGNLISMDDLTEDEPIIVNEPAYMFHLFTILHNTHINLLASYLSWSFVHHISDVAFGKLEQTLHQFKLSTGLQRNPIERTEKCVELVSRTWSHAIAQTYIALFTNESARSQAEFMLRLLQQSFIYRLNQNSLLDDETRTVAIEKIKGMLLMVGYPSWILDNELVERYYENYPDTTGHYVLDHLDHAKTTNEGSLSGLRDSPVRESFSESPMDVNAYYYPTRNSITVPMGILNPPIYHHGAPSSTIFGGLGRMLGHEITHAFDNDGRKYDQNGNLQSWWPQSVVDRFEARSKCFVRQYNRCCPIIDEEANVEASRCVNGEQTLGETIADNGGLRAAYQAWQWWTAVHGEDLKLPGMENYTSAQIFFLSFANYWCESFTLESLLGEMSNSEHAPNFCRVNGALANSADFANAFNCSVGPMNNGRKTCGIW